MGNEGTSTQGQAFYFTVAVWRSSWACFLPQIALIQRIHSVERWLLTDVNGHVNPTELVYFRKKSKVHLSIVPMRSVFFEKYCTMINAFISRSLVLLFTQSCPTDNSIMIYEADSV